MRALLSRTRNADGGWPYTAGHQSRIEPTAWALLTLKEPDAARLLSSWRDASGLIVEPGVRSINYAFNALAALALAAQEPAVESAGRAVAHALLTYKGTAVDDHPAIKQDSSLQAWSWTAGTFSWVEPTAWCLLAVKKLARDDGRAQARITEAERLLADRACQGGGWNTGNPEVYGQALTAYVPPTAIAVLALQDRLLEAMTKEAVSFLTREATREGSTMALALSWLAFSAVGVPALELVPRLANRVDVAEGVGNLASAATMLYALDLAEQRLKPAAFTL